MKRLEDYTQAEIQHFDEMHRVLTEYNARVQKKRSAILKVPPFTDNEMAMYSGYRELVIAKECEEE